MLQTCNTCEHAVAVAGSGNSYWSVFEAQARAMDRRSRRSASAGSVGGRAGQAGENSATSGFMDGLSGVLLLNPHAEQVLYQGPTVLCF